MIPDISVVVPLFNKRAYIQRCLDSILRQTVQSFEVIVVDDGSNDGSADIVVALHDPRIRLCVQENQGPSAARYRGVQLSRARLVGFLDADDEWETDFLEAVLDLETHFPSAALFATGFQRSFSDGSGKQVTLTSPDTGHRLLVNDYFARVRGGDFITSSSTAVRREALNELGRFSINDVIGEDADLWARLALRYPFAFDVRILAVYHSGLDGASMKRWRTLIPPPPPVARTLRLALSNGQVRDCDRDEVETYIDWRQMKYAEWLLDLQKRSELIEFLSSQVFHTRHYRWRKLFLRGAAQMLPMRWVRALRFKPVRIVETFRQVAGLDACGSSGVVTRVTEGPIPHEAIS